MAYEVYEAASAPKELIIVDGADHGGAFGDPRGEVKAAIGRLVGTYMDGCRER